MARTATARKAAAEPAHLALARELIGIHRDNRSLFGRIDELKGKLKQLATAAGATLRETFDGIGTVSVRPATEKRVEGNALEVVVDVWNALPKKERDGLLKKGVVKEVPNVKSAYYGSVEVKLFA